MAHFINGFDPGEADDELGQASGEATRMSSPGRPTTRSSIAGFDPSAAQDEPDQAGDEATNSSPIGQPLATKFIAGIDPGAGDDKPRQADDVSTDHARPFHGVVIGRRKQHRLDLELFNGSITDMATRSIVLGAFQHVKPTGAAASLDRLLDGAITRLTERRIFSAGLGEIFIYPTGTHFVRADFVVFAGLGSYDRFNSESQKLVAKNVIRSLIYAGIDDFGTLLFGGNSVFEAEQTLKNLIGGFVEGLLEADTRHNFRRVVLCELDPERYSAMKESVYRLSE